MSDEMTAFDRDEEFLRRECPEVTDAQVDEFSDHVTRLVVDMGIDEHQARLNALENLKKVERWKRE